MRIFSFKKFVITILAGVMIGIFAFGSNLSSLRGINNMENSTNTSIYNVLSFGAIANGQVDDTKAINAAIDYAAEHGGGIVWLPVGEYRINGTIFVYPGIVLEGAAWRTMEMPSNNTTTILAYPSSKSTESSFLKPMMPTIALSDGSTVKDLVIYYPDQDINNVIPYPPAISGSGNMMTVEDVTLINPYIGIDFMGGNSSLHYIKNVYGSPLHIGIEIDNCFDIGRVENVHFNPNFWQPGNVNLDDYIHNNLYAFIIGRSDWEYFFNTFVLGAKVGDVFERTSQGACNG
ncbi:MAG: glycoside hydrolase family 55 protein, partial [Candidatus Parvarchaeota archaeon]|nr:glycoside hydrolase family 55 protein [Candidatus Jingweiarchaeum tengchongense]